MEIAGESRSLPGIVGVPLQWESLLPTPTPLSAGRITSAVHQARPMSWTGVRAGPPSSEHARSAACMARGGVERQGDDEPRGLRGGRDRWDHVEHLTVALPPGLGGLVAWWLGTSRTVPRIPWYASAEERCGVLGVLGVLGLGCRGADAWQTTLGARGAPLNRFCRALPTTTVAAHHTRRRSGRIRRLGSPCGPVGRSGMDDRPIPMSHAFLRTRLWALVQNKESQIVLGRKA